MNKSIAAVIRSVDSGSAPLGPPPRISATMTRVLEKSLGETASALLVVRELRSALALWPGGVGNLTVSVVAVSGQAHGHEMGAHGAGRRTGQVGWWSGS